MKEINAQAIKELVSRHPTIVNFGGVQDAVSSEWLHKAEDALGLVLPNSYKWFLKNYAGGEIGSEEIFSIYGMDFDSVRGGDIVYQHITGRRAGLVDDGQLVVSESDFGEVFFFDYSSFNNEECLIKRRLPSGAEENYANDFYEFLYRRIMAHL